MRTLFLIILILSIHFFPLHAAINDSAGGVEFSYDAPNAGAVSVAGSFNGWNNTANPLQKDTNGIWKTTIPLQAGKFQYKYVVDGNWNYDQDNSETADDGYGGQNSSFEIGSDGKLLKKVKLEVAGIKTSLNPKITFTGRYYTENIFKKNNFSRYTLQKPLHDINLIPLLKFSNDFTAQFVWKINNQLEGADMYKTHLKYLNSEINLHTELFDLSAFDNIGKIRFDDPLHFVGDDGKYHYNFGWGFRGIGVKSAETSWHGFSPHVEGIFTDGTRIADFHEGDLIAGRAILETNFPLKPKFGYSTMSVKIPILDRRYNNHLSSEFDLSLIKDLYNWGNIKPLRFEPFGEYYQFRNRDVDTTNVTWLKGNKIYTGMNVYFPKALKLHATYEQVELKFPTVISRQQLEAGGQFELDKFWIYAGIEYRHNTYPDSAEVSWNDYYRYMEKTNGNGRWFQQYTDVPWERFTILGYKESMLWNSELGYHFNINKWNYTTELMTKVAQTKISAQPRYIENIFILEWQLSKSWYIDSNTRIPYYNDNFLGLKTDIGKKRDFFWSNYTQLEYRIASNVKVAVGWGVNPMVLSGTTDNIGNAGRENYLGASSVIGNAVETQVENAYFGLGNYIRNAEKALRNEQRINVTASMSF
jgi:hypothetical protein